MIAAFLALVVGCTSDHEPELPPSSDVAAIADRVTGPDGQAFLQEIISASWSDDGRRAAELFTWVPRDAKSPHRTAASRAGKTAHAVATFLADESETLAEGPANPVLWQSFAESLVPYLGAMIGDEGGVVDFSALDGLNSQMDQTTNLFAAMTKDAEANRIFTEAAVALAHSYEVGFAKAALAEPILADRGVAQRLLLQAARLRGLIAASGYMANPESGKPLPLYAQTELAYQVASLTARPGDPHIDPAFFTDGHLVSPSEIPDDMWSIYDSQLTVYLATSGRVLDAIYQFGDVYADIVSGQQ